jgi:activator of HSP90 ATPase
VGLKVDNGNTKAEISEVRSLEGDVDVSQRKGKVISLFDLNMVLAYKGSTKKDADSDPVEVSGTITVPEIAYDTEPEEYDFNISINSESSDKEPVKVLIRKELVPKLRSSLHQFGPDLISEHGKDIQHPDQRSPYGSQDQSADTTRSATPETKKQIIGTAAYNTVSLQLEHVFNAPAQQLYDALLKPEMVSAWSRSKAEIAPTAPSKYSLFGGNITGEIKSLVEGKSISQTWRLKEWKAGHYANVDIELIQGSGETVMKVNWTGIPVGQEEVVKSNFEEYYVRSIKVTFGFGTVL